MPNRQLAFLVFIFISICRLSFAQNNEGFGENYTELCKNRQLYNYPIEKWDSLRCAFFGECASEIIINNYNEKIACPLTKKMFGWHMIGTNSNIPNYVWQSISDLSYFSYDVDEATGKAVNQSQITSWASDAVIVAAHNNNVKISLCATLFNSTTEFSTFFGNTTAQQILRDSLIAAVKRAGAKGINIDFEGSGLGTTYLTQFVTFMTALSTQLHTAIPGSQLSIDLGGSNAASSSLLTQLNPVVDLFILMGYDYYWGSQGTPGPVAPLYDFHSGPYGHVSNDLNSLTRYINPDKIILAVPYYGRRWGASNGCTIPGIGSGTAQINAVTYAQLRQNANGYYTNLYRDNFTYAAYYCFNDATPTPNQAFFDDAYSLQKKYDVVKQRGIAGIAVWKLGNDNGYSDLWNLINNNFSTCASIKCSDTIYDMGGPNGNYHNNENYTFTIAPPNAVSVTINFLNFNLESGYDSIYIYNGTSALSPLLGKYSGTSLPPNLIANSGKMTVRFHSDGATVRSGYIAVYNCDTISVGINKYDNLDEDFRICPNPVSDKFSISGNDLSEDEYKIELRNILGEINFTKIVKITNNSLNETISIKEIPCGVYFISVISQISTFKSKILKI